MHFGKVKTMKKTAQDVTVDLLKDQARTVDFTRMITEQQQFVDRAKRMAGTKPTKVEQAYIDEQRIKLNQLEDIVKNWIYEAFADQFIESTTGIKLV